MNECCKTSCEVLKEYDPQPLNKDGSIRWFLYRWDDGKKGQRILVQCKECRSLYLVQRYRLNKFSVLSDNVFEDWYSVESEQQADFLNRTYTGVQLERKFREVYSTQYNTGGMSDE